MEAKSIALGVPGTATLCNRHWHWWWNGAVSQWVYDVFPSAGADMFYCLWARIHPIHQRKGNTGRDGMALEWERVLEYASS